jgi:tRNA (mo5U34)-methyltransferase
LVFFGGFVDLIKAYGMAEQARLEQMFQVNKVANKSELLALYHQGWQRIYQHGDFSRWAEAFAALPDIKQVEVSFSDTVSVRQKSDEALDATQVEQALKDLLPWRKGPFEVFGVYVDAEWRSDMKWQRVLPHISSLQGRKVLDIGCGSGYHLWRMLEQGAKLALGIDTSALFAFHFAVIKRYTPKSPAFYLPAGIGDMLAHMASFDTVFSMGILYHRKNPLAHLMRIKGLLKAGGEVVLETLVVDGDAQTCLIPDGRYAKMKNVWFLPSVAMLSLWMKRLGFKDVRCVDINVTSSKEQRVTDWMRFESLADYLDPNDSSKTIEGHPAPKRAMMIAHI